LTVMKDFFKEGNTKHDFLNKYFDPSFNRKKLDDKKKKTIFETYILIDPDKSKFYGFWQFIMLISCLAEFLMIPYVTGCKDIALTTDKNQEIFYYNVSVDFIWLCNIMVCFVTSHRDPVDLVISPNPKTIAISYIK